MIIPLEKYGNSASSLLPAKKRGEFDRDLLFRSIMGRVVTSSTSLHFTITRVTSVNQDTRLAWVWKGKQGSQVWEHVVRRLVGENWRQGASTSAELMREGVGGEAGGRDWCQQGSQRELVLGCQECQLTAANKNPQFSPYYFLPSTLSSDSYVKNLFTGGFQEAQVR